MPGVACGESRCIRQHSAERPLPTRGLHHLYSFLDCVCPSFADHTLHDVCCHRQFLASDFCSSYVANQTNIVNFTVNGAGNYPACRAFIEGTLVNSPLGDLGNHQVRSR